MGRDPPLHKNVSLREGRGRPSRMSRTTPGQAQHNTVRVFLEASAGVRRRTFTLVRTTSNHQEVDLKGDQAAWKGLSQSGIQKKKKTEKPICLFHIVCLLPSCFFFSCLLALVAVLFPIHVLCLPLFVSVRTPLPPDSPPPRPPPYRTLFPDCSTEACPIQANFYLGQFHLGQFFYSGHVCSGQVRLRPIFFSDLVHFSIHYPKCQRPKP